MRHTTSRFIAFFDECGDHSLQKIDQDFPIFVLSTVIFERSIYVEKVVPAVAKLKLQFWDHEGINLHNRDIRRAQGDFLFLQDPNKRGLFLESLNSMIKELNFTLFVTAIDKIKHQEFYGPKAINPYDLSMLYTFERVMDFLETHGEKTLPIVAESRGKNEDEELQQSFKNLMVQGSNFIPALKFQDLDFSITFRRKHDNIVGTQIADLCAYPTARKILNHDKSNKAFDIISSKFYSGKNFTGLKAFL